jgi:hypothetical protein
VKYHERAVEILKKLKEEEFAKSVLLKESAFTRKPNMTFEEMVKFMLQDKKKSLSAELIDYYNKIGELEKAITKQAYSEQRQHISYEVFTLLNEEFVKDYYEKENYQTWNGYVVLAIDGSTLEIPNVANLKKVFGSAKASQSSSSSARAGVNGIYDVLNNVMILSKIDKYQKGEKKFLTESIDELIELMSDKKLLLIFDRGYICTELLLLLEEKGVKYLFRCPSNSFKKEIKEAKTKDEMIDIKVTKSRTNAFKILESQHHLGKIISVRLVNVLLDTNEIEHLVTNLVPSEFSYEQMSQLYFSRWAIEKSFDVLKNKLQIENIGARTENGVKQEFYACILLYNFLEDIRNQMDKDIENNKGNKYEYKVNMNILVGTLKDNLIMIVNDTNDLDHKIEALYQLIKRNLVAIRPDRSNPRVKKISRNKHKSNSRRSF